MEVRQRDTGHGIQNMPELGRILLQEFSAGRCVKKKIPDLDHGPCGSRAFLSLYKTAALDHKLCAS